MHFDFVRSNKALFFLERAFGVSPTKNKTHQIVSLLLTSKLKGNCPFPLLLIAVILYRYKIISGWVVIIWVGTRESWEISNIMLSSLATKKVNSPLHYNLTHFLIDLKVKRNYQTIFSLVQMILVFHLRLEHIINQWRQRKLINTKRIFFICSIRHELTFLMSSKDTQRVGSVVYHIGPYA